MIKNIYNTQTANTKLNDVNQGAFPLKSRTRQRYPLFSITLEVYKTHTQRNYKRKYKVYRLGRKK